MRKMKGLALFVGLALTVGSPVQAADQQATTQKKATAKASPTSATPTPALSQPISKPTTSTSTTSPSTQTTISTSATASPTTVPAAAATSSTGPTVTSLSPTTSSGGSPPEAVARSPLEGMTWQVKVIPDAMAAERGEKPFDETLNFQDGKVSLSTCAKLGFAPSEYTVSPAGQDWSLTTQQVSREQGETKWIANLSGKTIRGELIWTKPDGTASHYNFSGTRTGKP